MFSRPLGGAVAGLAARRSLVRRLPVALSHKSATLAHATAEVCLNTNGSAYEAQQKLSLNSSNVNGFIREMSQAIAGNSLHREDIIKQVQRSVPRMFSTQLYSTSSVMRSSNQFGKPSQSQQSTSSAKVETNTSSSEKTSTDSHDGKYTPDSNTGNEGEVPQRSTQRDDSSSATEGSKGSDPRTSKTDGRTTSTDGGKDGGSGGGTGGQQADPNAKPKRKFPIFWAILSIIVVNVTYYFLNKHARERAEEDIKKYDVGPEPEVVGELGELAVLSYEDAIQIYNKTVERFPDGLVPIDDFGAIVAEQVRICRDRRADVRSQVTAAKLADSLELLTPTSAEHVAADRVEHSSKFSPRFAGGRNDAPPMEVDSSSSSDVSHFSTSSTSLSPVTTSAVAVNSDSKAIVVASALETSQYIDPVTADLSQVQLPISAYPTPVTPSGEPFALQPGQYLEMNLDLSKKLQLTDDWIDDPAVDERAFSGWLTNVLFATEGYSEEVLANPEIDMRVLHIHLVKAVLGKPAPTEQEVEDYLNSQRSGFSLPSVSRRRTSYGASSLKEQNARRVNVDQLGVDGDDQYRALRERFSDEGVRKSHEEQVAKFRAIQQGLVHPSEMFTGFISQGAATEKDMLNLGPRIRNDLVPISHAMLALSVLIEDYDTPTPQSIIDQEVYRPQYYQTIPQRGEWMSVHPPNVLGPIVYRVPNQSDPKDRTVVNPSTMEVVQIRQALDSQLKSRGRMTGSLRRRVDFLPAHRLALAWLCAAHMEDTGDVAELHAPPQPQRPDMVDDFIIPSKGFWPFTTTATVNTARFAKSAAGEVFLGYKPRPEETKMDLRASRIFKVPHTICDATDAALGTDPNVRLSAKGLYKMVRLFRATGHFAPMSLAVREQWWPIRFRAATDAEVTRAILDEVMNGRIGDKVPKNAEYDLESTDRTISFVDVESAFRRLAAREAPAYPWYYSLEKTTELQSSQVRRLKWLYNRRLNMRHAQATGDVAPEENRWVSTPVKWYERDFYGILFPTNWISETSANPNNAEKGHGMSARWRHLRGIQ